MAGVGVRQGEEADALDLPHGRSQPPREGGARLWLNPLPIRNAGLWPAFGPPWPPWSRCGPRGHARP
eukprot:7456746-Alexandrium_andersonii.AAC.1